MGLLKMNCPGCGQPIELDDSREFGFCTYCGTKVMVDKVIVEHKGVVTIDQSDELKNLYKLARRSRNIQDSDNAQKYYEMILLRDPESWEASFFSAYFKALNCKIAEIESVTMFFSKNLKATLMLINDTIQESREETIRLVSDYSIQLSTQLFNGEISYYNNQVNPSWEQYSDAFRNKIVEEHMDRCSASMRIPFALGDMINSIFQQKDERRIAVDGWKHGINLLNKPGIIGNLNLAVLRSRELKSNELIHTYSIKIAEFDPSYQVSTTPTTSAKSGGCYVATAVYGSYDCPQVWTLRRYRDYRLDSTWYGRLFIMIYYAISPTLVKWFGHTSWFKKMWKSKLDRMVERLQAEGYEDTPYNDKY